MHASNNNIIIGLFTLTYSILYIAEKPEIVQQPKNRCEILGRTNVNLTVTVKGSYMEFTWLKHGDYDDDYTQIHGDDDLYTITCEPGDESVIDHEFLRANVSVLLIATMILSALSKLRYYIYSGNPLH